MTSTRTPLPPPQTRVATCLWEGGCGWSRALHYPAIQDALLDHWQERHRSETVAGQRKQGARDVTNGAGDGTIKTAPARRANDGITGGRRPTEAAKPTGRTRH